MKNRRKKLISLCVIVALLVGMCTNLAGCGSKEANENVETESQPVDVALSRAEWITGLASTFGMTEYTTTEPFFTDVGQASEIYVYVQSCAEWNLFEETGVPFEPEAAATREFVVKTALVAAEVVEIPDEDSALAYEDCIKYAVTEGLLSGEDEAYLSEGIEPEEAQKILDWSLETYLYKDIDEKEIVVFEENVVDFREQENLITSGEENITIASSVNAQLEVGSIIILPATQENPDGIARKITSIETDARGNYVVTTETPELTDIFEELDIEKHVVPTGENIILGEGVTQVVVNEFNNNFSLVAGRRGQKHDGLDIAFTVGYSTEDGVQAKVSNPEEETEFSIMLAESGITVEEKGALEQKFKLANVKFDSKSIDIEEEKEKYKAGYSITGTFAIKDLYADVDLELKKALGIPYGVKELSVAINCDIEESLTLEGKFEGEKKISTIPISIVPGVLSLNVDVILYVDANGVITIKVETGNFVKYSYYKEKSKYSATSTSSQDVAVMADIEVGGGVSPEINTLGICVMDMAAKVGVKYDFDTSLELKESKAETEEYIATNYEGVWKLKLDYYLPVVTLSVGAGEDCLLQLDLKKELIGPKGTVMKIKPENLLNEEHVVYRMQKKEWKDVTPATDATEEALEAFINAPVNARITYDNFYSIDGLREFINQNPFYDKSRMDEAQQYVAGTDMYYSEDDRYYADGHVEKGAELSLRTQEEEKNDRDYSLMYYNESELTMLRTDRVHVDKRGKTEVGNVGGFSDFLIEHGCATVPDLVEALGLSDKFKEKAAQTELAEIMYNEKISSEKYGKISITLKCEEGYIDLKSLSFYFEDGSASPYKEIHVSQQLANTYTDYIPILRVGAYTPAYFEGE